MLITENPPSPPHYKDVKHMACMFDPAPRAMPSGIQTSRMAGISAKGINARDSMNLHRELGRLTQLLLVLLAKSWALLESTNSSSGSHQCSCHCCSCCCQLPSTSVGVGLCPLSLNKAKCLPELPSWAWFTD